MQKGTKEIDFVVGKKIADLRTAKGVSRQELATKLGITHQQLHKNEKGNNRIILSRLLEICKIFDVSIEYFLGKQKGLDEAIEARRITLETIGCLEKLDADTIATLKKLIKKLGENGCIR